MCACALYSENKVQSYRNRFVLERDLTLTNGIGTKLVQHATLCDGFEGWTSKYAVHSLLEEVTVAQV